MSTLKANISTPVKAIHNGEDIVDSQGNLVCVMADKIIDSNQIVSALNEQAEINTHLERCLRALESIHSYALRNPISAPDCCKHLEDILNNK